MNMRRFKKTGLKQILLMLLLVYSCISFSNNNFQFSHISVLDGLPSTIIRKIIQDNEGYMWFATKNGLARYDGYNVKIINDNSGRNLGDIRSLLIDADGVLLIASATRGLFSYKQGEILELDFFEKGEAQTVTALSMDKAGSIWLGTNNGTYKVINSQAVRMREFTNDKSYSFLNLDNKTLLAQTKKSIVQFDIETNENKQLNILPEDNYNNYVLHQDSRKNIWLGRTNGLYLLNNDCHCFKNHLKGLEDIKVYSLTSDDKFLWIGTTYNGLFLYDLNTAELINLKHDLQQLKGLSDDSIFSLYIDKSAVVWVGTFHSGVNFINPNVMQFGTISHNTGLAACAKNYTIHDTLVDDQLNTWLATENGLVKMDENNCVLYSHEADNEKSLSADPIIALYEHSDGNILIMNENGGLDEYMADTGQIVRIGKGFEDISFYFADKFRDNVLILGSHENGLYMFKPLENELIKLVNGDKIFDKASFYSYAIDKSGRYYFGTNYGIAYLDNDTQVQELELNYHEINKLNVPVLNFDSNDKLWFAVNNQYLLIKKPNDEIIDITANLLNDSQPIEVTGIITQPSGMVWLSSNRGIFKINDQTYENWYYSANDGLQDAGFLSNSYYQSQRGKIYFGGKKGVNYFYPEQISANKKPPTVVLTTFNYFNKKLEAGIKTDSSLQLQKPIDYLEQIELGYKDYIIGFEFAALDYADSQRNKYAYRLLGLNDRWVQVDASDRKATYTNLKAGHYVFQVKAANKDGAWSEKPKEIKIWVHPAPWLSTWAFVAYFLTVILSIWGFIRYKTISSRKRAQQLEVTVKQRTQEVNMQKKMVESLLDHKNEVFANVTHEFKTPLALILGPIEQLANEPELKRYNESLTMVQRNAKRLMLMVGQILKLSQAEVDKEIIREPQGVQATLIMLYESFKPLANDKKINLILDNNHDVNIYATPECLEIVVGNLLSNALKFTTEGGEIQIRTTLENKRISISVKDTGTGIEQKDLDKVFNRFVRLDTHRSIQGTGIGLSVVKEITQANDGNVAVESQWGKGSEFTVTFAITAICVEHDLTHAMVDQLVANTQNELSHNIRTQQPAARTSINNRVTVLIIEDNLDMQAHIGNVLEKRFNCLFADRGRAGIATALKEVPDIVICDVMMPGMDGYQVTRILRHDSRTSHIPIILLTALNTKESRIKGWREHIDVYVTKPFDATELNVQLDNILTIRKILQKNTNKALKTNESLNALDLPKQDLKFIEKFRDIIAAHYGNEYFQKADISVKMAVSERQLQRKIKALIGENPMDIMRDYRLEKASMKLKDGYQVSLVSDECGFGSVSYFGKCFKRRYGVTPKKYQQMAK
jgi:signal transduction histidine kinase/ligand-binding sensor domain-containing protein/AraC-like DNA-binding protein